nr:ShlB/FhaC/HecB family hemolysin secretion/activation protein [uncultured Pseudomonas sp.]
MTVSPFLHSPMAAALALACFAHPAVAQTLPDAGVILQQVEPSLPSPSPSAAPAVEVQSGGQAPLPESPPFLVNELLITGNTLFSADELHALVAQEEGRPMTLLQIDALAGRITAFYQQQGYPLARAIIPAQTVSEGVVKILVVEARYGQVQLNNRSDVRNGLLDSTLAPLRSGAVIDDASLNRSLLLLSDIPGVGVAATLKPGAAVGTSDLDVATVDNPVPLATVAVDNFGNRYVGRERLSANLTLLNPLHLGDVFTTTLVTSGSGMNFGRLSYEALLNGAGTRAGAAYSHLNYRLGDSFSDLDANGTAELASVWLSQPLLRSRNANLYAQAQFDNKRLRDDIDATDLSNDRDLNNWVLSLNGDVRDDFLGGAISAWSIGLTSGRVNVKSGPVTSQPEGGFSKLNANFSRLQGLTPADAIYLSLAAQWSDVNLDSAEKVTVGGPYSVRAYDVGVLSGDIGYAGTLELRHDLGTGWAGRWQAIGFFDSAYVKINRRPIGVTDNSATLSGAGVGLNWSGPQQWRASASLATPVGDEPSVAGSQSTVRAWATLSKAF